LFIQTPTIDVYVNVLVHCIKHEQIKDIFFIGREAIVEQKAELEEVVRKIYTRIIELSELYSEYISIRQHLPPDDRINEHIIHIDFLRPHKSISKLKKIFPDKKNAIIDITGAGKQLAGDVMASFMVNGFLQVCHFVLDEKVLTKEWQEAGKSKLYHDLINDKGITRYTYANFSKSDSTVSSFQKLRAQGNFLRILLLLSGFLAVAVVILIAMQKTNIAQITAISSVITIIASLIASFVSISKILFKQSGDKEISIN